jgi:broad specificity phosphatase PhoE
MQVTLICHGPTRASRAAVFPSDEPLDRPGPRMEPRMWPDDIVALSCPSLRACQTARLLGLEFATDPLLRDCDYGEWVGRRLTDIYRGDPDLIHAWLSDADAAPHGGEALASVCARAAGWLRLRQGEEAHTIAISHPSFIRAAMLHVLGAGFSSFWRIDVVPLTCTDLRWNGQRWVLRGTGLSPEAIPA